MAQNLCRTFSIFKNYSFNKDCLTQKVRHFQSFQAPQSKIRVHNVMTPTLHILKIRTCIFLPCRNMTESDVNTNVLNNVVLFKYENAKYFKTLSLMAIGQILIFGSLAYLMLDFLPKRKDLEPLTVYSKRSWLQLLLVILPIFSAMAGAGMIWAFVTRSVKYIILKRGGEKLAVVTYHPFKGTSQVTVPVEQASVRRGRDEKSRYVSVKLKPKRFFYVIHKEGKFVNPELYDNTIGYQKLNPKKK